MIQYVIGLVMGTVLGFCVVAMPLVGMDKMCSDHHGGIWLFEPAKCKGTP